MLQKLFIQNYIIIEELSIEFSTGLNVITGETGAGKSILVGALELILGARADASVLFNKEKKCVIEGGFQVEKNPEILAFLSEYDFDPGSELVIRREIGTNGKSRAFVNDTPVLQQQLQLFGRMIVDLHQQFDTAELAEADVQRKTVDALAGNKERLEQYSHLYSEWQNLEKEIQSIKAEHLRFEKESDYNRFQYQELEQAAFTENEIENSEAEIKRMENAEGIKSSMDRALLALTESENPLVQQIRALVHLLQHQSDFIAELPGEIQRLRSVQAELQDIAGELSNLSEKIQFDPERLEKLNERLSLGYKLQKKHGVQSTAALVELQNQLEKKLIGVSELGERIAEKEKELARLHTSLVGSAEQISGSRKKIIKPLEESVNKLLACVGMPNAKIRVAMYRVEPGPYGSDRIEFLFNANTPSGKTAPETSFQPLRKVASGGELSRLMLCIKSLVAETADLATLLFDEIDSGISGEAAKQAGIIMKEMAANRQIICITHQPQIAGKADTHFYVYKEVVQDRVKTNIRVLTTDERIIAIAKMLSGEKPTSAAIENAREMMMN